MKTCLDRRLIVTLCLAIAPLVGCSSSLVGSWSPDPANDGDADGWFRQVQFKKDGTFNAISRQHGESVPSSGKYEFDGFNLMLKSPGRPERSYRATYIMGGKLELKDGDRRQTLKKQ